MKLPTKATDNKRRFAIMMTPLIDVIFLLMIFFIMTLNFLVPEGILENRLPDQARTTPQREKDWELVRIHVATGKAGPQIYLQERKVARKNYSKRASSIKQNLINGVLRQNMRCVSFRQRQQSG